MVAIELAEELLARGMTVDLHATSADPGFVRAIFGDAIKIVQRPEEIYLAGYDLVYAQHHVFQLILYAALRRNWEGPGPFLVWNHLSPVTPLEAPGGWIEASMADVVLANSAETQAMLARHGPPFDAARVWPNPAPAAFARVPVRAPAQTFLTVSNHSVPELDKALALVERQGVSIRRIGERHVSERVEPAHLAAAETVVTIGKTVQYALRARRQVYCYGPHGGPGWLTPDTYVVARDANFSGRSHSNKKEAETIARELLTENHAAGDLARTLDNVVEGFSLETLVDGLLEEAAVRRGDPAWQAQRRALFAKPGTWQAVALEANLCVAIRNFYLKTLKARGT